MASWFCGVCDSEFSGYKAARDCELEHFREANTLYPVTTYHDGSREYNYYSADFESFTPFGKCLALAGFLKSDFPVGETNLIPEHSRLKSVFAYALNIGDDECVAEIAAESHNIGFLIPILFNGEPGTQKICRKLLLEICEAADEGDESEEEAVDNPDEPADDPDEPVDDPAEPADSGYEEAEVIGDDTQNDELRE